MPDLNGPAAATVVFTAEAIAVDSAGFRLRAQRAPWPPRPLVGWLGSMVTSLNVLGLDLAVRSPRGVPGGIRGSH